MNARVETVNWQEVATTLVKKSDFLPKYDRLISFMVSAVFGMVVSVVVVVGYLVNPAPWAIAGVLCGGVLLAGAVGVLLNVDTAKRNAESTYWLAMSQCHEALDYFSTHLGEAAALALSTSTSGHDLHTYATAYQWLALFVGKDVVDQVLQRAFEQENVGVVGELRSSIRDRSGQGWATDHDVKDVTEAVLEMCLATDTLSGRGMRDGLRRVLYQVETSAKV
jgi:hypothetical protein